MQAEGLRKKDLMGFSVFLLMLRIIVLCLVAYFGAGYSCIRLYEAATFYTPFSKELTAGGVYNNTTHRKLTKECTTPFLFLLLISLVLIVVLVIFTPGGVLIAIAGFVAGVIVYYMGLQSKKAMIRLFCHRYRRYMNEKQLQALLKERYDMSLDELTTHKK